MLLPPPNKIGLPERYVKWRQYQDESVLRMTDSPKRFITQIAPTGSGKSISYIAAALLRGDRTMVLTSTKGLQSQLLLDLEEIGMVDIRGRNAYYCRRENDGSKCDHGPCLLTKCSLKNSGCEYYDHVKLAQSAKLVVTNYTYWMTIHEHGDGLGDFDLLICDEAHDTPDVVSDFMTETLDRTDPFVRALMPSRPSEMELDEWARWAGGAIDKIELEMCRLKEIAIERNKLEKADRWLYAKLMMMKKSLDTITKVDKNWVVDVSDRAVSFSPVWPTKYCEKVLFMGIPKVILTSATVNAKTCEMLNIPKEQNDIKEYPHPFPRENRLLIHIPTVRMNHKITGDAMEQWCNRIDQILHKRQDRKGIIHTVSYARRDYLLSHSRFVSRMVTHSSGNTEFIVNKFKKMDPPAVLVSPSVSTGYDFPDCVVAETKVLTKDLRWVELGTVQVGDELIGFDEDLSDDNNRKGRHWKTAIVQSCEPVMKPSYRVVLEDGTEFRCSDNHGWLVRYSKGGFHWIKTKHIRPFRTSKKCTTQFARLLPVWDIDKSYEAGYLSGVYDGEGSLHQKLRGFKENGNINTVSFVQALNITLMTTYAYLFDKGFEIDMYPKYINRPGWKDTYSIRLRNRIEVLKFLGSIRPPRLLEKFNPNILGSLRLIQPVRVLTCERIGMTEVIAIKTSTGTFIAEGFGSHNSMCRFQIIGKLAYPDTRNKIVQARTKLDDEYGPYIAAQQLVQSVGRSVRHETDHAENFIIDDNIEWFMKRYKHLMPQWFREAFVQMNSIPDPPAL